MKKRDLPPGGFRDNRFEIQNQKSEVSKPRIQEYRFNVVKNVTPQNYAKVKAQFGPLASTDPDLLDRHQKDKNTARFNLSQYTKETLAVNEEERRVIEERVKQRIMELEEEAKSEAAVEGYKEGLKKGHDEAFKKLRQEATSILNKLETIFKELEDAKNEIYLANERFLIDLVFKIARMILLREIKLDSDYLCRLIKKLVSDLGVRENFVIRLNDEDLRTIVSLREALEKTLSELKNYHIEPSSSVARGGCQIETQWNVVDASIETQIDRIREALFGKNEQNST